MTVIAPAYRPRRRPTQILPPTLPPILPKRWMMSDGANLPDRLPADTGIIFRHYAEQGRAETAETLAQACRICCVPLLIAGDWRLALRVGADGIHLPEWLARRPRLWHCARPDWIVTAAAHNRAAVLRAAKAGAHGVLISPVFPTRSHPDATPLGPMRFAALAKAAPQSVAIYALGGMNDQHFHRIAPLGAHGWAGLGAFR